MLAALIFAQILQPGWQPDEACRAMMATHCQTPAKYVECHPCGAGDLTALEQCKIDQVNLTAQNAKLQNDINMWSTQWAQAKACVRKTAKVTQARCLP